MIPTGFGARSPISQHRAEGGGEFLLSLYALDTAEQQRRKAIAEQARKMIMEQIPVEDQDETSLTAIHRDYFMQISFSPLHPLILICLARSIPHTGMSRKKQMTNELNLSCVLGSHAINEQIGCYSYRAVHWMDTELTEERFFEILERCTEEADRGYHKLTAGEV